MTYPTLPALCLLVLAETLAAAPPCGPDDPFATNGRPEVELTADQQLLQLRIWELLDLAADGEPREQVLTQLARSAAYDVRPLFEIYAGTAVRAGEGPPDAPQARRELLLEALNSIAPEPLFAHLRAWAVEDAPSEVRLRSVELLAASADPRCLDVMREILTAADPVWLTSPRVRTRVEDSLGAALERHRGCLRAFARDPEASAPQLWPLLAGGAPGGRDGTELLLSLLGRDAELDCLVLERLGLHARTPAGFGGGRLHVVVVDHVRDRLEASESEVRQQALVAIGYLVDPDSFPRVIELLGDPERAVQRSAVWSLERASSMHFGADSPRWSDWFDAQIAWLRQTTAGSGRRLLACPDADAIAIIREFTQHALFRHVLSDMLAPVLFRENRQVVAAACAALKQLGSTHAIGPLIEGLGHVDPECRIIIHRTLEELTGRDLPAERGAWETGLAIVVE